MKYKFDTTVFAEVAAVFPGTTGSPTKSLKVVAKSQLRNVQKLSEPDCNSY